MSGSTAASPDFTFNANDVAVATKIVTDFLADRDLSVDDFLAVWGKEGWARNADNLEPAREIGGLLAASKRSVLKSLGASLVDAVGGADGSKKVKVNAAGNRLNTLLAAIGDNLAGEPEEEEPEKKPRGKAAKKAPASASPASPSAKAVGRGVGASPRHTGLYLNTATRPTATAMKYAMGRATPLTKKERENSIKLYYNNLRAGGDRTVFRSNVNLHIKNLIEFHKALMRWGILFAKIPVAGEKNPENKVEVSYTIKIVKNQRDKKGRTRQTTEEKEVPVRFSYNDYKKMKTHFVRILSGVKDYIAAAGRRIAKTVTVNGETQVVSQSFREFKANNIQQQIHAPLLSWISSEFADRGAIPLKDGKGKNTNVGIMDSLRSTSASAGLKDALRILRAADDSVPRNATSLLEAGFTTRSILDGLLRYTIESTGNHKTRGTSKYYSSTLALTAALGNTPAYKRFVVEYDSKDRPIGYKKEINDTDESTFRQLQRLAGDEEFEFYREQREAKIRNRSRDRTVDTAKLWRKPTPEHFQNAHIISLLSLNSTTYRGLDEAVQAALREPAVVAVLEAEHSVIDKARQSGTPKDVEEKIPYDDSTAKEVYNYLLASGALQIEDAENITFADKKLAKSRGANRPVVKSPKRKARK